MLKKWRTLVALALLIVAIVFQWWWFFSMLFLLQIIITLLKGKVEYVEEIKRSEFPFLYWLIVIIWTFLGIYSVS